MKKVKTYFLIILLLILFILPVKSQLNKSYFSLNYRNNLQSHFTNLKFEIGSKKTLNFFSLSYGLNFSSYSSSKSCPYDLNSLNQPYAEKYINYESKKAGFQFSLGYSHHFRKLENKNKIFPYLEIETFWYRIQDDYNLNFINRYTDVKTSLSNKNNINTLSCESGFGIFFEYKKLLAKIGLNINYFWPIVNRTYNPVERSFDDQLPFVGVLLGLQIGISYQLF